MEDVKITKSRIGDIIIQGGPYCSVYKKKVDEKCWEHCHMYCRYHEVRRDEDSISRGEGACKGYRTNKWKHVPNFFCYVGDTKIVDVPDFIKEDND